MKLSYPVSCLKLIYSAVAEEATEEQPATEETAATAE